MDQVYQKNDDGYMLTYQLNQNDMNIFLRILIKNFYYIFGLFLQFCCIRLVECCFLTLL